MMIQISINSFTYYLLLKFRKEYIYELDYVNFFQDEIQIKIFSVQ